METIILYFVNLPLVVLIIYSVCEIIWSPRLSIKPTWIFIKAFLLLVGTSLAYLILWMQSQGAYVERPQIQNDFFGLAIMFYSLLADAYILKLIRITWPHEMGAIIQKQNLGALLVRLIIRIQKFLLDTHFVHVLAFISLILLLLSVLFGQIAAIS